MKNYLLLYSGGMMPDTEAERKSQTDEWNAWYSKIGKSVVDQGNPFTPMAKNIGANGRIHDGPDGCMASGYSIIKADSLDSAVAIAKNCPVLKSGASISVFETFDAMGAAQARH